MIDEFIKGFLSTDDLNECWLLLVAKLKEYRIERCLFARKEKADIDLLHNHYDLMIFSTYGAKIDQMFVENRKYMGDLTIKWCLENEGWVSWRMTREKYLSGEMTSEEETMHLITREMGLVVGCTVGMPIDRSGGRSGFGLCFSSELSQGEVDEIWHRNQSDLNALLSVFDLAAKQYARIPENQKLTSKQQEVLRLVAEGNSIADTSALLQMHRRTVEDLLKATRNSLACQNTAHAVHVATRQKQI